MASDAMRKKNICVFFEKKHVFYAKKTWPKKKTLKKFLHSKSFFFKYSFKRNYKLTVA